MSETAPAILARELRVRAGGHLLLDGAALRVEPGEVVLLAGPSGCGKSVLLGLLAGLVTPRTPRFEISGRLEILGRDVVARPGASGGLVGIVFQDFALFEGATAGANVAFALDHRRPRLSADEATARRHELLDHLGIEDAARVGALSGGQRQRVAIARALAFAPRILAYDEPTSGLDPALRDRVVALIRTTSREHGATTIVVTHDLAGLVPIADRVVLLDPSSRRLEEVEPAAAEARLAGLEVPRRETPRTRWPSRAIHAAGGLVEGTARALEGLGLALLSLLPRWRSARWGLRFLGGYLRAVAGPGALVYFLLAGAVVGLVASYFTFTFLPYREFTESLLLDDLTGALGFGLHRILVPLIMTILLAARAGAAISADVSTRVAGRQTDAMRALGAPPRRYLLTGIVWAFLLGAPLVGILSFAGARIASAIVFAAMAPDVSLHAWTGMFHRLLDRPDAFWPAGTAWVAAKELSAAFGIGAVAYFQGARPKRSPEDVARAITSTVIWATVLVLAIHTAFALVEF